MEPHPQPRSSSITRTQPTRLVLHSYSRSALISLGSHAEAKVLSALVSLAVAVLLVEFLDGVEAAHIFADAGADFLERLVKVARVQDALFRERVGLAAHEMRGFWRLLR